MDGDGDGAETGDGGTRSRLLAELSTVSRRCMASYTLFNQAVADHLGLHPTDLQCLNLLTLETDPVTTGRVAELTGLTTGSATRLVDRLERAGYVVRHRDTTDRRRVLVTPVPDRIAEFTRLWERAGGTWTPLYTDLTTTELTTLLHHMTRTITYTTDRITHLREGRI
ncbi:helix-turn-helix domain-containing protein [Streptomyces sp. NPDC026672]|uniref:MarR family winged helix-turn-helix transcriptional regulator n=1 Tax=unclassified Streptomyces TaxID=2593676 RepID=UPI0033EA16B2